MSSVRMWIAAAVLIAGCGQEGIDLGSGLTEVGDGGTVGDTSSTPGASSDGADGSVSGDSGGETPPRCETLDPNAVVFINFDGAEIVLGPTQDATQNQTPNDDFVGTFPPFGGDGRKRAAIFDQIRALYAPFNIAVVDERPTGRYGMVMVGPTKALAPDVGGVGAVACGGEFAFKSLGFVSANPDDGAPVMQVARLTAAIAAWGLGLEPVEAGHPEEVMSDMLSASPTSFSDECLPLRDEAMCPSRHEDSCGDPQLQNSFVELIEHWGPCPE